MELPEVLCSVVQLMCSNFMSVMSGIELFGAQYVTTVLDFIRPLSPCSCLSWKCQLSIKEKLFEK